MTRAELESKPLAELHALAAERGVDRYRMLSKAELVDQLAGGDSGGGDEKAARPRNESRGDSGRRRQRDRERRPRQRDRGERGGQRRERRDEKPAPEPEQAEPEQAEPEQAEPEQAEPEAAATPSERPRRK